MKGTRALARTSMCRLLHAGAILAFLTGAAAAQGIPISIPTGDEAKKLTPEEQEKQDRLDKAYKSATQKIPDKKSNDPWGSVRTAPATASQR